MNTFKVRAVKRYEHSEYQIGDILEVYDKYPHSVDYIRVDKYPSVSKLNFEIIGDEMYKPGDKFVFNRFGSPFNGDQFLLAAPEHGKAVLINTKDGNRWTDPLPVKHAAITLNELKLVMGTCPDKFTGVNCVYPPEPTLKIGDYELCYDAGAVKTADGRLFSKEFINKEFIPAWHKRKETTLDIRANTAGLADVRQEVLNKLNDGRICNRNATGIGGLFAWYSQPEGVPYWNLVSELFTLVRKINIVGLIDINDNSIKIGCKVFSEQEVNKFIEDYLQRERIPCGNSI